jgi:hypothetical protein
MFEYIEAADKTAAHNTSKIAAHACVTLLRYNPIPRNDT